MNTRPTPPSTTGDHAARPHAKPAQPPAAEQRERFERSLRQWQHDQEPAAPAGNEGVVPWGPPLRFAPPFEWVTEPLSEPLSEPPLALPVERPLEALFAPAVSTPRASVGVETAAGATPRTAPAQDAVSTQLRALGARPLEGTGAHWQLQWAGPGAPVQQVDLRCSEAGALRLDITGSVHASDPTRLARLRERVAARAPSSPVLVAGHAPGRELPDSRPRRDGSEAQL